MANVLVRDVSDVVLAKLKTRAASSGRSLQAEMHTILKEAAEKRAAPLSELETARRIRNSLAVKKQRDGAALLREDRRR
ncbi:MAG: hypothetical protein ABR577_14510 [Pyrinomonadaceae bacterium]